MSKSEPSVASIASSSLKLANILSAHADVLKARRLKRANLTRIYKDARKRDEILRADMIWEQRRRDRVLSREQFYSY